MHSNRIRVSKDATHRLKMLKGRTGLTPNLLCRIAFCHSLNDPRPPNPAEYDSEGLEFNRFTLTGEWDALFMALLKERCIRDGIDYHDPEAFHKTFTAHLNRGVVAVFNKARNLQELYSLIPQMSNEPGVKA